ncbi:acyloxyacyl hydrolase [Tellurirhabdus bombi]|uniref:acyloxyacyl hydrolase n=1 Tax=Tellurirhabdus bombi TaxID=2907205 RepID=UPI001F36296F|nr:acyloxyacyl hydrolase [Tellurirhabdus bombi]
MKWFLAGLCLYFLGTASALSQADTTAVNRVLGAKIHSGFIIPHSSELRSISGSKPIGFELTYSRMALSRRAWERCNCFARVGAYVNYYNFNDPVVLGQTVGAGGYFEPLISYRSRLYFSARITAGFTYLTRIYDSQTNPENVFFSLPVSALVGLGASAHYRLNNNLHFVLSGNYNHISNGGIRKPNKGMNFPTLSVGLEYHPQPTTFPAYQNQMRRKPDRRWTYRAVAFGAIKVMEATDRHPELPRTLLGSTLTAGYRLNSFHALSGGFDLIADGSVRETIRRDSLTTSSGQLALLAGYELWQGRYTFAVHMGWNLLHPGKPYSDVIYQRYQLLYRFTDQLVAGVGLKANKQVAEGFDVRLGVNF